MKEKWTLESKEEARIEGGTDNRGLDEREIFEKCESVIVRLPDVTEIREEEVRGKEEGFDEEIFIDTMDID